jgi:phosphoglycerate dehydrogenase-like enzyme
VAVLSRQGAQTLAWDDVVRLERLADVRYHQLHDAPDHAEAVDLLRRADILASTNACLPTLDATLLDALPDLRTVVLYATGYDHIDVALLASRGVGLTVLPDYATNAVAEHAIAMLFSMATRLHLAHDRSRGAAPPKASLRGIELAGRTMGVVGVGRIGTRVAQLGAALGMRALGHDTSVAAVGAARHAGVTMASRDRVLADADALLVCASHSFGAPLVIGAVELDTLRPDAFVINVARADLVDTAAVTTAIRAGALRGYAVDDVVLDPAVDGDLLAEGRVLQTGHSAWWRDEVLDRGRRMWAHHLLAAIGGAPVDAVTWPDQSTRVAALDERGGRSSQLDDDDDVLVAPCTT